VRRQSLLRLAEERAQTIEKSLFMVEESHDATVMRRIPPARLKSAQVVNGAPGVRCAHSASRSSASASAAGSGRRHTEAQSGALCRRVRVEHHPSRGLWLRNWFED
jgi:hypothetical protein